MDGGQGASPSTRHLRVDRSTAERHPELQRAPNLHAGVGHRHGIAAHLARIFERSSTPRAPAGHRPRLTMVHGIARGKAAPCWRERAERGSLSTSALPTSVSGTRTTARLQSRSRDVARPRRANPILDEEAALFSVRRDSSSGGYHSPASPPQRRPCRHSAPGTFLRPRVTDYNIDENVGHGRRWTLASGRRPVAIA